MAPSLMATLAAMLLLVGVHGLQPEKLEQFKYVAMY